MDFQLPVFNLEAHCNRLKCAGKHRDEPNNNCTALQEALNLSRIISKSINTNKHGSSTMNICWDVLRRSLPTWITLSWLFSFMHPALNKSELPGVSAVRAVLLTQYLPLLRYVSLTPTPSAGIPQPLSRVQAGKTKWFRDALCACVCVCVCPEPSGWR